jgi:uncharacterized membrane protein
MSISESKRTRGTSAGALVESAKQVASRVAAPRKVSNWWTFLAGAGSVMEIFPPPERIGPEQTDAEALDEDWQAVKDDLWAAIDSYEASLPSADQLKIIQVRSAMMPRPPKSPNADWPSPEMLEAYEKVVPGSAQAVLDDFLKKSEQRLAMEQQRLAMEQQSLSGRISIARWGQIFGFVIGIVALITGAYTATQGFEIAGSFIGTGGVVGLVSVFVLGRIKLGETTVDATAAEK